MSLEIDYRKYVDLEGLAKEIREAARNVRIEGWEVDPAYLLAEDVSKRIGADLKATIAKMTLREIQTQTLEKLSEETRKKTEKGGEM